MATQAKSKAAGELEQLPTDPEEAAAAAGLRYVSDADPGIRRVRHGTGFRYLDAKDAPVEDEKTLERIRALAIPPAYTDVWICPSPRGHIQATGRDARGRKQYRYHAKWREARDETKFGRMLAFAKALPTIRRRLDEDLARRGHSREKVLAAIVSLLECTSIRVGNDEYARTNRSFGLTTLKDNHVDVAGSRLTFEFNGKGGKPVAVDINDRRLARIVQRSKDIPGQTLFQFIDDDGNRQTVDSGDVNDYIRSIAGEGFTAKDFRTWAGTVAAAAALREMGIPDTAKATKANIVAAIDRVAERLNNTRTVCRKYYVHPAILEAYERGELVEAVRKDRDLEGLEPEELAVVVFLRGLLERSASTR
jgi:DNA topoisomerase I